MDHGQMAQPWLNERLYFEGDKFFSELLEEFAKATTSIDLESYIYEPDEIGRRIEKALIDASNRGVKVRLLVDGLGALNWIDKRSREFVASPAQLRIYHPIYLSNLASRLAIDLGIKRVPKRTRRGWALPARLNRRNHRKICIIDSKVAFVGSINVSANHSAEFKGKLAWRDTAIRVEGEGVRELVHAFEDVWHRCHNVNGKRKWRESLQPRLKLPALTTVLFNHTLKLRRAKNELLLEKIAAAKTRVWIRNAYFAPSRPILEAFRSAVERGADVRIILPSRSDVFFMPWVQKAQYPILLENGVKVMEYQPRFLHAKTVIIDDWAIVGSTNFNRRSFIHDFEVDVVVTSAQSLNELEEAFRHDQAESKPIDSARLTLRSLVGRWFSIILKNWI